MTISSFLIPCYLLLHIISFMGSLFSYNVVFINMLHFFVFLVLFLFYNNMLPHFVMLQTYMPNIFLLHNPYFTIAYSFTLSRTMLAWVYNFSLIVLLEFSSKNIFYIHVSIWSTMSWILYLFKCYIYLLTLFIRFTSIYFFLDIFPKVHMSSFHICNFHL